MLTYCNCLSLRHVDRLFLPGKVFGLFRPVATHRLMHPQFLRNSGIHASLFGYYTGNFTGQISKGCNALTTARLHRSEPLPAPYPNLSRSRGGHS
jgi:hypothetical protein